MTKKFLLLGMAVALMSSAGTAEAVTWEVESFAPDGHSISIPELGQPQLHFVPGATLEIEGELWTLSGELTSATDGTTWALDAHFTSVLTDPFLGPSVATAVLQSGVLMNLSAGTEYELIHPPDGTALALFGPGMNDRNDRLGLSAAFDLVEYEGKTVTGNVFRGEINLNVGHAPEPNAALVFAIGAAVVGGAFRSRRIR